MMNMSAAKLLRDHGKHRPSVTRSYYAAYCAITDRLSHRHRSEFGNGGNNPSHEQIQSLTRNNLEITRNPDPPRVRSSLAGRLKKLWALRISAEYIPGMTVNGNESLLALNYATGILDDLELAT